MGRRAKPPKGKAEAKRSLSGKSPKNEGSRVRDLEKRLAEALQREAEAREQEAAAAEILRLIASSPGDAQPVFDAIAVNALRLCDAQGAVVVRYDGTLMHLAAHHNVNPEAVERLKRQFPVAPDHHNPSGRAILEGAIVHVPDLQAAAELSGSVARQFGARSHVSIPLLHHGRAIGAIGISRPTLGPFSDRQITLLKTFADQAVIAIENVRLFNETKEALEQQTATGEILRVISSSPTDVQPVFDMIAENARRLCDGHFCAVFRFDGELIHLAGHHGLSADGAVAYQRGFPLRPERDSAIGRAILDRAHAQIPDVEADPEYGQLTIARAVTYRAIVAVPMLRDGKPVGGIAVSRSRVGPFSDKQLALLATFADQAVIATQNVRLFQELHTRTQDLTRSVEELTALGEIGQVVSSTLDLQEVLTTIVTHAVQLSKTDGGTIYEFDPDEQVFVPRANYGITDELVESLRQSRLRIGDESVVGQAAGRRTPVQIPDLLDTPSYPLAYLTKAGFRALLAVPVIRDEGIVGMLVIRRHAPGEFHPPVVGLLQTFATQSVLAIQNARLFQEIERKSRQLEAASQHKSEFLANMSHELRTPLNAILGFSEVLAEQMFGEINDKQAEYLRDVLESGRHLLSLINDILDLSKIEAGRMELEPTDFGLPSAIDNALTLVRERAGQRGIILGRAIDERVGTIHADERKVKQVLLNLLSNALKFTPQGGRIDVRAAVNDENMLEVSVADTGVGIAPEDQGAIFEEFRQVGTADKKVEGTGLGLALSLKFIELHGGRIGVKSQVGTGSTFTFTIPVRRAPG